MNNDNAPRYPRADAVYQGTVTNASDCTGCAFRWDGDKCDYLRKSVRKVTGTKFPCQNKTWKRIA